MNQTQKIIKYFAIALAFLLIFTIITTSINFISAVTNFFSNDDNITENLRELEFTMDTSNLDIDVTSSNIIFKTGDSFKIETNNKKIELKETNDELKIKEKKRNYFNRKNSDLVITVPVDYKFNKVEIDSGAGVVDIAKLNTEILDFDLGAGKVDVDNLNVLEKTSIEGGAGKISIKNSIINNLDLDMGVGELTLNSLVIGNSKINAGVGKLTLDLIGIDYKVKVQKGIGEATFNDNNMKDSTYYGEGSNIIEIDGGVGSINISVGN